LLKMSPSLSRLAPVGNDSVSLFVVSSCLSRLVCLHGYFSSFPSPRSNCCSSSYQSSFYFSYFILFCFLFYFLMTTNFS
jgi:hypothetical protein